MFLNKKHTEWHIFNFKSGKFSIYNDKMMENTDIVPKFYYLDLLPNHSFNIYVYNHFSIKLDSTLHRKAYNAGTWNINYFNQLELTLKNNTKYYFFNKLAKPEYFKNFNFRNDIEIKIHPIDYWSSDFDKYSSIITNKQEVDSLVSLLTR